MNSIHELERMLTDRSLRMRAFLSDKTWHVIMLTADTSETFAGTGADLGAACKDALLHCDLKRGMRQEPR